MPAYRDDPAIDLASLGALPAGSAVSGVATRLLDLFTSGSLPPGTRLPAERQLAARLQVGRSAVREALAALEVLGVVEVRPGSGTYLRGTTSELLPQSLSWGVLIGHRNTEELLELRSGLEIFVARLAAERISEQQLRRLDDSLERMRDAAASGGELAAFVRADRAFHREIADAAGNRTLNDQLQLVRSLLRIWVDRAVGDPEDASAAVEEHRRVHRALSDRDPDAAAAAMARHMATASARIREADSDR